jgi:hypothetical protein
MMQSRHSPIMCLLERGDVVGEGEEMKTTITTQIRYLMSMGKKEGQQL